MKNASELINFINYTSHLEFETIWDFNIFLENKWIDINISEYENKEIPFYIMEELCIKLNLDC